jgi:nucleoside-diphosphate-sugar epimerase
MKLAEANAKLRAIYRTEAKRDSVVDIFAYYHQDAQALWDRIDWVKGDVLDVLSLEEALSDVTQVYHCAAAVTFLPADRPHMHKVNVEGTANVVNLCVERNIRLCHVSSVAAIGRDGTEEIISEKNEWKESDHNAAYAVSKHRGEMEVWRGTVEGLNAFIVNPSLIIGPGDWNQSTGAMFRRAWRGLPFYTRGGNCFVDALDVAEVMVQLMMTDIRNERFIVGAENRKFKEVFDRIAVNMNKNPPRVEATRFMTELTWRAEKLIGFLSGRKPFITKEVAHHALQYNRYDNRKLLEQLPDFSYRKLDDTLDFVCQKYMADMRPIGQN